MRILLCDRLLPSGPAAGDLITWMQQHLEGLGHSVEQILLPFLDNLAAAPQQLMALRLMTFTHTSDCLLTFGSPMHILRHHTKVIWCCNEAESLLPDGHGHVPEWMCVSDRLGFGEAKAVYAATETRRQYLAALGIDARQVLVPGVAGTGPDVGGLVEELLPRQQFDAVAKR